MGNPKLETDVIIIGAGPAGSAAGAKLVAQGHRVLCLERLWFPRHVIGESLLPRCNDLLASAGLLDAVQARRYTAKKGARFFQSETDSVRFCFADGFAGQATSTFQVPRDDFDQTLATRARQLGVDVRFGHQVDAVSFSPGHAHLTCTDLDLGRSFDVTGKYLLDCSGYGRVLARLLNLEKPAALPPRVAVFTMVEGDERPAGDVGGDIWVTVHPKGVGWVWIIPFSDGRTSVGVVGDPELIDGAGKTLKEQLFKLLASEPVAARRLAKAEPVLKTMTLRSWTTAVTKLYDQDQRWALAGNAGDFLDPVFSSGVCLALESSSLAADLTHRTLGGERVDWQKEYGAPMTQAVGVFRAFVKSWYTGDLVKLFLAEGRSSDAIRKYITSVLAGYVLNNENPLVRDPDGKLKALLHFINLPANNSGAQKTDDNPLQV